MVNSPSIEDAAEEGCADIIVNGERLLATTAGAAYWPDRETLIVADLHFEKGTHYACRGVLLPPYDTRTTLKRLVVLAKRWRPKRIISLGDAFHDAEAEARMDPEDAALLERLLRASEWIWILGNHDPEPPARFRARVEQELAVGRLMFRHEPTGVAAPGELCGHLHPCARVKAGDRLIRRRCFVGDGSRLILPAFGAYTGGLNVLDQAYAAHFIDFTAWVLGGRSVYPFGRAKLAPDGPGGLAVPWRARRLDAAG